VADWTYAPIIDDAAVESGPPVTLQTKLDDGKVISRIKHANIPERWTETYQFDGTTFDTAKAFYDARGIVTSFTKLSWDVYGTPTQERTVRFASPWSWQRSGQNFFTVSLTFERHY
jgi:hypothetical protein